MLDWKIALGVTSTFYSIGKSFEYIKRKYGILTSVLTHIGLSVASTLMFLNIMYIRAN